jgi:hypothetical protein
MSDPDDNLEARVSALESQMRLVRADAAAARVLAGGADRDVSAFGAKLDAHTRALNALRETQLELREVQREQGVAIGVLGQRVDGLTQRVDGLTQRVDSLEGEMRKGFAMTAAGMARITTLLEGIAGLTRSVEVAGTDSGGERGHSAGVKVSAGPAGSVESRTAVAPLSAATSTH